MAMTKQEANRLAVQTPRILREFVREQYAQSNLKRLHEIGNGEVTFSVPVAIPPGKGEPGRVEMVDCEAPAMVQVVALKTLVEVAIPKQMGLVDADDRGTGVVILPALDRAEAEDADFEIVAEEIGPDSDAQLEDRDRAPAPREETVSPALVQHVIAARKNGKHPKRTRHHG